MNSGKQPEIYFHAGLGRTATTFVQRSIFPKFKDIYYIQKKQYKNADQIIASTQAKKYLISHEFYSGNIVDELREFSKKYPDAKIIIVLRRQDKWMASHYKRSVKKGHPESFEEYIDLENDTGYRKVDDLFFFPKIKEIEKLFNHKPLILFHQDLKDNPQKFLQQILDYTGVKETRPISFKARHTSYSNKELRVRQWVARNIPTKQIKFKRYKLWRLLRLLNMTPRYTILFMAKLIPDFLVKDKPIIANESLKKIRELTREDWEKCVEYAKQNNPDSTNA